MSRDWKSGDVAIIRSSLGFEVIGMRSGVPLNMGWAYSGTGPTTRQYGNCWMSDRDGAAVVRPVVTIDPESDDDAIDRLSVLLHQSPARIRTALRHLTNPKVDEPTDPTARVTDRRENVWRLLADGDWVCTSGPDIGEYLVWDRLASERGPIEVLEVQS